MDEGTPGDDQQFVALRQFMRRPGDHHARKARSEPPRGLSRPDIVAAAMAVADAEGADAVSMRRVARELGVGAMSLYWHVASKEELHQLMIERVQGEASAPEPTGDWRADLKSFAQAARDALLRHPWAIDFVGSGPPSGPNDARNAERLLAALDGLGLSPGTAMWVGMTVGTYVFGAALREVQEIRCQRVAEEVKGTMSASEIAAMSAELRRIVHDSGSYPHIAAVMDAGIDPDAPESRDERFEFGLDCVLDGIEARIRRGVPG